MRKTAAAAAAATAGGGGGVGGGGGFDGAAVGTQGEKLDMGTSTSARISQAVLFR